MTTRPMASDRLPPARCDVDEWYYYS